MKWREYEEIRYVVILDEGRKTGMGREIIKDEREGKWNRVKEKKWRGGEEMREEWREEWRDDPDISLIITSWASFLLFCLGVRVCVCVYP